MRRGGRGVCRFTGLRSCEDTYRKVDETRVVQILMLQGCERGSGVYDSLTAWVEWVSSVERERQTPEQRKTRTKEVYRFKRRTVVVGEETTMRRRTLC